MRTCIAALSVLLIYMLTATSNVLSAACNNGVVHSVTKTLITITAWFLSTLKLVNPSINALMGRLYFLLLIHESKADRSHVIITRRAI